MTASEKLVYQLCTESFLGLWSFASPRRMDGRELCDILVLFEPHLVIISVKDIGAKPEAGEGDVAAERWNRRAIEDSAQQLYGAERELRKMTDLVDSTRSKSLPLPPANARRIHRIAMAFGGRRQFMVPQGNYGKGFVHVFDEPALSAAMHELDTVADFIRYLTEKQAYLQSSLQIVAEGEEDLLALYVSRNRQFPVADTLIVRPGTWSDLMGRPEYIERRVADQISYVWDKVIAFVAKHALDGTLEFGGDLSQTEKALRIIASEDRFARRILGEQFLAFLDESRTVAFSRMLPSPSVGHTAYVFLAYPRAAARRGRTEEAIRRCKVALRRLPDCTIAVGIATEQSHPSGFSLDLVLVDRTEWTPEAFEEESRLAAQGLPVEGSVRHTVDVQEYPGASA